ncbi:leucyl/phenylalanyl-tRNA--protein transferase [Chitinimonas lacunae]|uniref:Leucyl/phenylalanyl-tRNA--protein transferase n=1 Tax=Chitinimonas lacunae TaxID=1963018 RepID=A0ABV8MSH7_9NEIS
MLSWLTRDLVFPPVEKALADPNGLLAVGGDLSAERLLLAYRQGIFPWYSRGEPILWWSPNPRMVLYPSELKVARSLVKTLRHKSYEVRFDSAFGGVIRACANTPRPGQNGTWIGPEIIAAYEQLHQQGYAHSAECWIDGELAGGVYGIAIGRMFYGESMFAHRPDASKIAFVHLVRWLDAHGFGLIDCQMRTEHLTRFGGREIARSDFLHTLTQLVEQPGEPGPWRYHGAAATLAIPS